MAELAKPPATRRKSEIRISNVKNVGHLTVFGIRALNLFRILCFEFQANGRATIRTKGDCAPPIPRRRWPADRPKPSADGFSPGDFFLREIFSKEPDHERQSKMASGGCQPPGFFLTRANWMCDITASNRGHYWPCSPRAVTTGTIRPKRRRRSWPR